MLKIRQPTNVKAEIQQEIFLTLGSKLDHSTAPCPSHQHFLNVLGRQSHLRAFLALLLPSARTSLAFNLSSTYMEDTPISRPSSHPLLSFISVALTFITIHLAPKSPIFLSPRTLSLLLSSLLQ